MIRPNELRVGNIIHFPFTSEDVEVFGIAVKEDRKTYIQVKKDLSLYFELPNVFKPIPITEKQLDVLVFEKQENAMAQMMYMAAVVELIEPST